MERTKVKIIRGTFESQIAHIDGYIKFQDHPHAIVILESGDLTMVDILNVKVINMKQIVSRE